MDAILVPTSGGGMVAGISVAAKRLNPNIKIFIVEPKGKNSEQSLKAGERLWKPPFNLLGVCVGEEDDKGGEGSDRKKRMGEGDRT